MVLLPRQAQKIRQPQGAYGPLSPLEQGERGNTLLPFGSQDNL